jgi:hypothetical protein
MQLIREVFVLLKKVIQVLACAFVMAAIAGRTSAAQDRWAASITPFNQVFPALELSQSGPAQTRAMLAENILGYGSGLISVRIHSTHAGERVRLTVSAVGLTAPSVLDATLARANVDYELHPPLSWDVAQLADLTSARPQSLHMQLEADGTAIGGREIPISLRPLDEALYYVRDGREHVDLSWIFAAYVNENDPVVDQVIDLSIQSGIVDNFKGYAGDDGDAVRRQVWAIWQALATHGIRYSGADPGISRGPRVYSQHVRSLAATWADRAANCVDGSVLLASALRKVGIGSFLVLVPGHAFLGFYTDADSKHSSYLETTLIGATLGPLNEPLPSYASLSQISETNARSLASFEAALRAGNARYARVAAKFDGHHRPDYVLVDIAAARAYGIVPVERPGKPFGGSSEVARAAR